MARPVRELDDKDYEMLEEMANLQMTKIEMCKLVRMDEKTLTRLIKKKYGISYSEWFDVYSEGGKLSLRRAQFRNAVVHNNAKMQMWLGKQWLGQVEPERATDKNLVDMENLSVLADLLRPAEVHRDDAE